MEYKDYYKILGMDRDASEDEIKRRYRKLARELHPDVNPGDKAAEARFKEINEAYEVLGTPEKRAKYDRLGTSWRQWQRAGRDPGGYNWSQWAAPGGRSGVRVDFSSLDELFGDGSAGGFSDFFNTLFGGMPGAGRSRTYGQSRRGQDVTQPIEITLEEAFQGTTRTLLRDGKRIQAKIPAGARTGTKIRLAGQGAPGSGAGSGNLYLSITLLPHPHLKREGDDLHIDIQLDLFTAVLGGDTPVETLEGEVQLKIPSGTQGGQTFKLRGQGMPILRKEDQRGDLFAQVFVQIPKELSVKEQELFQELSAIRKR